MSVQSGFRISVSGWESSGQGLCDGGILEVRKSCGAANAQRGCWFAAAGVILHFADMQGSEDRPQALACDEA